MSLPDDHRPTLSDHDVRVLFEAVCADCPTGGDPSVDRAWHRLGDVLTALMCDPYEHGVAPESAANPPSAVPSSAAGAAITRRVRARDLRVRAVRYGEAVARVLRVVDTRVPAGARAGGDPEVLIALSLAAGQARCLCNRLTDQRPYGTWSTPAFVTALETALVGSVVMLDDTQSFLRATPAPDPGEIARRLAEALDGAGSAVDLATRFEHDVLSASVDATGADLSRLDIPEPDLLAGIVWTDTTTWPARLAPRVRSRSNRLAAGVYRVRRMP